jgi:hypothetical protein
MVRRLIPAGQAAFHVKQIPIGRQASTGGSKGCRIHG